MVQKPGTVYTFKYKTGPELVEIENVDNTIKNEFGATIQATYASLYGNLFVRHKTKKEHYYQAHLKNGTPVGKKYPVETVVYMVNDSLSDKMKNDLVPFEILDKEKQIYWPILFKDNDDNTATFIEKPDYIVGLIINPTFHWMDINIKPKSMLHVPGFNEVATIYKKDNQEEIITLDNLNLSQLNGFSNTQQSLTKKYEDSTKSDYTDYVLVPSKDIDYNGYIYDRNFPVFKTKEGKYFYPSTGFEISSNNTFETKGEALNSLSLRSKNIDKIAWEQKTKDTKTTFEERMASRQAYAESKESEKLEREQMEAEILEKKQEENRKAANSPWNSVGQQIQKAGQEASQKAKCLNKQTQTKKDYLANKQGWYNDGGCK